MLSIFQSSIYQSVENLMQMLNASKAAFLCPLLYNVVSPSPTLFHYISVELSYSLSLTILFSFGSTNNVSLCDHVISTK